MTDEKLSGVRSPWIMDQMASEIESALRLAPADFGGGCSLGKARVMASLVVERGLDASVDIGVYRGRSLFPLAIAHRHVGGTAFGVDPWCAKESVQHDNPDLQEELDRFAAETDFEAIYLRVEELRKALGLEQSCSLLRMRSDAAIRFFEENGIRFGLVHIDGNHDTVSVVSDFELYAPRIRDDGFLVLDDISWDSVNPVVEMASSSMAHLYTRSDGRADYAVFQKASPGREARRLGKRLAQLEEETDRLELASAEESGRS